MATISNQELLKRIPLFAALNMAQLDALSSSLSKQRFKRNECVIRFGETSNSLYIILNGKARVQMSNEKGRDVILAKLKAGDYVGEMSLIDGQPHSATVVADEKLDTLVLSREGFAQCVSSSTSISFDIMVGLVKRLRDANQKISSIALQGVYGRVAQILFDSAVPNEDGQLFIRDKLTNLDLARMVGASREMVSRVMKDFEQQSLIEVLNGGTLRVTERRSKPRIR
jgi:CRP-like cAMP-binding protein